MGGSVRAGLLLNNQPLYQAATARPMVQHATWPHPFPVGHRSSLIYPPAVQQLSPYFSVTPYSPFLPQNECTVSVSNPPSRPLILGVLPRILRALPSEPPPIDTGCSSFFHASYNAMSLPAIHCLACTRAANECTLNVSLPRLSSLPLSANLPCQILASACRFFATLPAQ